MLFERDVIRSTLVFGPTSTVPWYYLIVGILLLSGGAAYL